MTNLYSEKNSVIVDVTKAPYFADNTGASDCTGALQRALDDFLRGNIESIEETLKKLKAMGDPNAQIGFESKLENGVPSIILPEDLLPTSILYFPNGTYLVSDTISYTLDNLQNIIRGLPANELNKQIHFKGESRDGVVIKLKDHCPGFEFGNNKPVVSFMRAERSNVAMSNTFEDITIDCGKGNLGAVGLIFFANNSGAVKNVRIVSSDENKKGYAGLEINHEIVSGCYVKNVEIDGFDYGIRAIPTRNFAVFENIKIKNQRKFGFFIKNMIISIRGLHSENSVCAVQVEGPLAHVVLVDSKLYGGNPVDSAVNFSCGTGFVRNVDTFGYAEPIRYAFWSKSETDLIKEYVSDDVHTAFDTEKVSEPIEVLETPEPEYSLDIEDWAFVGDYGALGDGVTDDSDAIQRAMDSGKRYVFFGRGKYLIGKSILIPENVERVGFMFCDFAAGEELRNDKEHGAFVVCGDNGTLVMEDVLAWEGFYGYMRFIEHRGKRTLVMSDLHTQTAPMYFNSVPGGRVFIENCACTVGGFGDSPYRNTPCFAFKGQKVWARHINPERSFCEVLNDGGSVWIMGFKTENYGTAFKTVNGGHTEVLGGTISIGKEKDLPAIVNHDSTVSVVATTNDYDNHVPFPIAVEEKQGEEIVQLRSEEFPVRLLKCYKIPLYVGRKK